MSNTQIVVEGKRTISCSQNVLCYPHIYVWILFLRFSGSSCILSCFKCSKSLKWVPCTNGVVTEVQMGHSLSIPFLFLWPASSHNLEQWRPWWCTVSTVWHGIQTSYSTAPHHTPAPFRVMVDPRMRTGNRLLQISSVASGPTISGGMVRPRVAVGGQMDSKCEYVGTT